MYLRLHIGLLAISTLVTAESFVDRIIVQNIVHSELDHRQHLGWPTDSDQLFYSKNQSSDSMPVPLYGPIAQDRGQSSATPQLGASGTPFASSPPGLHSPPSSSAVFR
ncbi:hypothetical protein K402DRAFT_398419 [Aulographum hederae CBS 113979]|uniref:Secreted protein n=1 Tax=Aulographum hederae CBS 113979 TaxID=1176131 RepID=A0A6G1GL51_9PEZI|nr:hypothetical protein K402DRAFT_398419 [Aulographum hederae CBS 113979]